MRDLRKYNHLQFESPAQIRKSIEKSLNYLSSSKLSHQVDDRANQVDFLK